jgi:hypothetical protein
MEETSALFELGALTPDMPDRSAQFLGASAGLSIVSAAGFFIIE